MTVRDLVAQWLHAKYGSSRRTWDKLPEDERELFQVDADELISLVRQPAWERHARILEQHVAAGDKLSALPEATGAWLRRQRAAVTAGDLDVIRAARLRATSALLGLAFLR